MGLQSHKRKFVDGSIAMAEMADAGIATAKIADNAVTSAKLDVSTIQYAEVAISSAEILALRAAPKTIVAAPGAGKVLEFVSAMLLMDAGASAYTESADNMQVRYKDGSGSVASGNIEATGLIDATGDTMTVVLPTQAQAAKAACENQPLVLHNTGDGEYAAGDGAMRMKVAYRVHATGW